MSATSRPEDLIRDHIRDNVLTDFLPCPFWDESQQPFTNGSASIILTRATGLPVNAFVRVHDVQVSLFSKENASFSDMNTLRDQANLACDYLMTENIVVSDRESGLIESVIEHVTGAYKTEKNRFFYRFTVSVLS